MELQAIMGCKGKHQKNDLVELAKELNKMKGAYFLTPIFPKVIDLKGTSIENPQEAYRIISKKGFQLAYSKLYEGDKKW